MIWESVDGVEHIRPIHGRLYRLVESQEQIATRSYVDSLVEQSILEELLEESKPLHRSDIDQSIDYLLKTPFRYPPLQYGSRFGRVHEPSLFYGSHSSLGALAEVAFYRFCFLFSMEGAPELGGIDTEHTLFSVKYRTDKGVQLQLPPFDRFVEQLCDPCNYTETQKLGTSMREADINAFQYLSARAADRQVCAGLFNSSVFLSKKPDSKEQWLCEVTPYRVSFKQAGYAKIHSFELAQFQVDGVFPLPASI